jgi:hypothetical protein
MKWNHLALAFLWLLGCASAYAETADELAAVQRQRDAAQARRDIATAEADEAKARLGTLDTASLPKGTGVASSLNVEGKILAYGAVETLATQIAARVAKLAPAPTLVVLYSDKDLKGVLQLHGFLQQTAEIHKLAKGIARPNAAGVPTLPKLESDGSCGGTVVAAATTDAESGGGLAPLTAVGAALQLLAIAKTDKKLSGADVEVSDVALANAVAGKLLANSIPVVYPASMASASVFSKAASTPSKVFQEAQNLSNDAASLDVLLGLSTTRRQDLDKRASAAKGDDRCKAMFTRDSQLLAANESFAKSLKTSIEQQTVALVKADDKTGLSALQALFESELLQASAAKETKAPHVLQISPIAAGGTTLTKTNFFTTNFFFSGGAVVSYALLNGEDGRVVLADTASAYGGYVKAEDLPAAH